MTSSAHHFDRIVARGVKQRSAVGVLGKAITRRSRGLCELCESRDQTRLFELAPFPPEPDPDRTLMACKRCRGWLQGAPVGPHEARVLAAAVWDELAPVRMAAALILMHSDSDAVWVRDALEASGAAL